VRKARNVLPPSGIYHVTGRGVAYCAIFRDDTDRLLFLARFRRLAGELDVRCFVYCLMTTHFHLLVATSLEQLSKAVDGQHLILSFSVMSGGLSPGHGRFRTRRG